MGLNTSYDCWNGGYVSFMGWRREIARAAGYPPLEVMEGFYEKDGAFSLWSCYKDLLKKDSFYEAFVWKLELLEESFPIKWTSLKKSPLHVLLTHSDCDGYIKAKDCGPIADELEKILPNVKERWIPETKQFITGLREAVKDKKRVEFY